MTQPTYTSAAVSEITRVAWWSLRAFGCPLGAVEAMARVLTCSEVLDGDTLAALRRNEAALLAAFASDEPRFDRTSETSGVIDAAGRSMLDIGPRAVDLITGLARRRRGAVRITVNHLADEIGLAGTATIAAQRGIGLLLTNGDPHGAWRFYTATSGGAITSLTSDPGGAAIHDLMVLLHEVGDVPSAAALLAADATGAGTSALELIAFPFVARDDLAELAARRSGMGCKDVSGALRRAYAHGVDVATADLRFLYELETRTWAPSSERSRAQAGFQAASPTP
ncbi:hypothetical protein F3J20_00635 [Paraburkholderia sp. Cy-641]|uniref:hypothetical protein n=1 Tax=Paraburkholderia sp. Cy-641 TaxID=2608337 RepID=UPI00142375E1|nr:hypothetical protein [Paraburkholderia sp. Cy-641]NIF75923.1 hypothetical protein [Paraburkholderia sp. Cy-641]